MTIRDALRLARDLSGLTQVQLAAALDVAQPNVAAYEAGSRKPGPDLVARWALATGTWIGTGGGEWKVIALNKYLPYEKETKD